MRTASPVVAFYVLVCGSLLVPSLVAQTTPPGEEPGSTSDLARANPSLGRQVGEPKPGSSPDLETVGESGATPAESHQTEPASSEPVSEQPVFVCPPGWHCISEEPLESQPAAVPEGARRPSPEGPADTRTTAKNEVERSIPPPPESRRPHHFGSFNLTWAPLGASTADGLGGLGLGYGYGISRTMLLVAGVDAVWGRDVAGSSRAELTPALSLLLSPAERGRWFPAFWLGAHSTLAWVDSSLYGAERYGYVGLHVGPLLQFNATRSWAIQLGLLGVLRTRVDSKRRQQPDFFDPLRARSTNLSGGAVLRLALQRAF